jgi:hypothetical protein
MVTQTQIKKIKQQAKSLAATTELSYQQALDEIARELGHAHFSEASKAAHFSPSANRPELATRFDGLVAAEHTRLDDYKQQLEISSSRGLSVVYAPFDHVNTDARIAIVGLTPGDQQARNALTAYREARLDGLSIEDALAKAKVFASFSGPMRSNLTAMLDEIGINRLLQLSSTSEVFDEASHLCHFTSLLRYPIFADGTNYSGTPLPSATPFLWSMVENYFAAELKALPGALWVPLGSAVKDAFLRLIDEGKIAREQVLMGLPHPSGANSERINYFLGRKPRHELSSKTNGEAIDQAKYALLQQLSKKGVSDTRPQRPLPTCQPSNPPR